MFWRFSEITVERVFLLFLKIFLIRLKVIFGHIGSNLPNTKKSQVIALIQAFAVIVKKRSRSLEATRGQKLKQIKTTKILESIHQIAYLIQVKLKHLISQLDIFIYYKD